MIKKSKSREQISMFNSLEDMISQTSAVRLIDLIVDTLLESSNEIYYYKGQSSVGRPAYSMSAMMKLFIYGYCNRIKSSRCLERECYRNIEVMWLLEDLKPDHRTIAYFRVAYFDLIDKFSKDFRKMLRSLNLLGNEFAIDGSKFKANANKDHLFSRTELEKRLLEIDKAMKLYLVELDNSDKAEEQEPEKLDKPTLEIKIKDLETELSYLKSIQSEMDTQDKNFLSLTDPDCNLMKSRDGKIPGYNVQIAVDTKTKFIASDFVTDRCVDTHQLIPAVEETLSELELSSIIAIQDKGYLDLDDIEQLELSGKADCFTSIHTTTDTKKGFKYDKDRDCYICSQGKELHRLQVRKTKKHSQIIKYFCKDCLGCPTRSECTTSTKGRYIDRATNQDYKDDYKERMKSEDSKSKLRKRKSTVECIFGTIKILGGKIPLLTRGKEKVQSEIKLYCLAYNVMHLINMFSFVQVAEMIRNYAHNSLFYFKIGYFTLNFKKNIDFFIIKLLLSNKLIANLELVCYQ